MSAQINPQRVELTGSWRERALCRGVDPDLFYPERGQDASIAKYICSVCIAQEPCREFARENKEEFGVWGGETREDRRRVSRREVA